METYLHSPTYICIALINSAQTQLYLYTYQRHVVNLDSAFKNRTR